MFFSLFECEHILYLLSLLAVLNATKRDFYKNLFKTINTQNVGQDKN